MKKRMLSFLLAAILILSCAACGKKENASRNDTPHNNTPQGGAAPMSEEVTIKNDVDASYLHDFVNLIPFYQDVPYVAISGDDLHPDLRYNWYSIVKTSADGAYPYARLGTAYSYALSDLCTVNGRQKDELEMSQYFRCTNPGTVYNMTGAERDAWSEYDGLLWYLTFLNYQCSVETEEDEYGTLVHVRISNTDMVKLLYEELKNTYQMVQEDNRAEAEKRINNSFDHARTYFEEEEENNSHLDHVTRIYTRLAPGIYTYSDFPVYGSSFISMLNLAELAGKLIYEGAKYQQNKAYWDSLSEDGTLYYYTLCQMILRMRSGDYDTVNSELTFYAEVDAEGNGYLPFDQRKNYASFTQADEQWSGALADILASKGLASQNCSMSNIRSEDSIYTWGSAADHDYENMVFWDIMGWRGSVVQGRSVTDRPRKIGYTGLVEEVNADVYQAAPVKLVEGKSVQADRDPVTGYYEVDGVLYDLSGGEAKAVGVAEGFSQTDLTLPKEINGCPVTTVGEQALSSCESLKTLAIPEGVRVLEYNAVASCPNLLSVSLPTTLEEIGVGAFIICTGLREVNIPEGVKICNGAFMSCMSLEEVVIPASVKELGENAFDNCVSLHIWLSKTTKCNTYALRGVAEISYGRPGPGSGSSTQTPAQTQPESYTVQLPAPVLNFGNGFYERYALRSRTSGQEFYYIGGNTLYRSTLPNLTLSYDKDGFLSAIDMRSTLKKESAEGQLTFSYEKDAGGKAAACTVNGNIYDIILFGYNRDNRSSFGGVPLAGDRERAEKARDGLPFRVVGELSAPNRQVKGLLSYSPLSAQDGWDFLQYLALELLGRDLEAERGMDFQRAMAAEGIAPEDLLAKAVSIDMLSQQDAQLVLAALKSDANENSSYSHQRIMELLGEEVDDERELIVLRDEFLSENPARYFWSGFNVWGSRFIISNDVVPVGGEKARNCQMTVDEDPSGKPHSVYLTDGTDVFEYIISYDSRGRMTDISYYQYVNGRQRDESTKRKYFAFTYDSEGRYTGYKFVYDGSVFESLSYVYDQQGRLTQQTYFRNNTAESQRYEYDDAGIVCRVTEENLADEKNKPVYVFEPLP